MSSKNRTKKANNKKNSTTNVQKKKNDKTKPVEKTVVSSGTEIHKEAFSFAILGLSAILLICVFAGESAGIIGNNVSLFLKHMLGIGALLYPVYGIIISIKTLTKSKEIRVKNRELYVFIFLLIIVSLFHILRYNSGYDITFKEYIRNVFNSGNLTNGGLMGGLIGGILSKVIGQAGAYIILVVSLLIMIILVTGKSVMSVIFGMIEWIEAGDNLKNEYNEKEAYIREDDNNEYTEKSRISATRIKNNNIPKKGILSLFSKTTPQETQKEFVPRFKVNIVIGEDSNNDEEIVIENRIVNANNEFISRKKEIPMEFPHLFTDEKMVNSESNRINTTQDKKQISINGTPFFEEDLDLRGEVRKKIIERKIARGELPDTINHIEDNSVNTEKSTDNINKEFILDTQKDEVTSIENDPINDKDSFGWLDEIDNSPNTENHVLNSNRVVDNSTQNQPEVNKYKSNDSDEINESVDYQYQIKPTVSKSSSDLKKVKFETNEDSDSIKDEPVIIAPEKTKNVSKLSNDTPVKEYVYPTLDLLNPTQNNGNNINQEEMLQKAKKLEKTLETFGVKATVNNISRGPAITRFELTPPEGMKLSKIQGLENEIALGLAAKSVRIEAPIPGTSFVGIEIPNDTVSVVTFKEILSNEKFDNFKSKTAFGIGKDITGNVIVKDIAKMPHLLIAGQTGSGKSVCVNSLIASILYKATPDEVKFILIDPKVVELKIYEKIPHLLIPVVTDPLKAAGALNWVCNEMDRRYKLLAEYDARNIDGYNSKEDIEEKLPRIIVVVDELADLMTIAKKDVEQSIQRITQLARAAGIYLIVATQRPSVDVITGIIKANIPSRIAFKVSSVVDSKTILDHAGADKLIGKGDMLLQVSGMDKPLRVQGAFLTDDEVSRIVDVIKVEDNKFDNSVIETLNSSKSIEDVPESIDSSDDNSNLIVKGMETILKYNKATVSSLQRALRIGYNRSAKLIDELCDLGFIGEDMGGNKGRKILIDLEYFEEWKRDNL